MESTPTETMPVVKKPRKKRAKPVDPVEPVEPVEPGEVGPPPKVKKPRKPRTAPAKPNAWLLFVKQWREEHPEESYKECLKSASVAYKASKEVTV